MKYALLAIYLGMAACSPATDGPPRALPAPDVAWWGDLRALVPTPSVAWIGIDAGRLRGDRDIAPLLTTLLSPGDPISNALLTADEVGIAIMDAAGTQRMTFIRGPIEGVALRMALESPGVLGGAPFAEAPTARGPVFTRGGSDQAIAIVAPNVLLVGDVTSVLASMSAPMPTGMVAPSGPAGDIRASAELPTLARAALAAMIEGEAAALVRAVQRADVRVILGNGIDVRAELTLEANTSPASAAAAIAALARSGLGAVGYSSEQIGELLDGAAVVLTESGGMPGVVVEVTIPRIAALPLLEAFVLVGDAEGSGLAATNEPEASGAR